MRKGLIPLKESRNNYKEGLEVLLRDKRFKQTLLTSPSIEKVADKLEDLGLKDYFDRIIAATAITNKFKLLTEDKELINLLKEKHQKTIFETS